MRNRRSICRIKGAQSLPKKKIFPPPLHHQHKLILGRMNQCFHVVYAKFWLYQNVPAEIRQTFSFLFLASKSVTKVQRVVDALLQTSLAILPWPLILLASTRDFLLRNITKIFPKYLIVSVLVYNNNTCLQMCCSLTHILSLYYVTHLVKKTGSRPTGCWKRVTKQEKKDETLKSLSLKVLGEILMNESRRKTEKQDFFFFCSEYVLSVLWL